MAKYRLYATVSVLIDSDDETPDGLIDMLHEGLIDTLPSIMPDNNVGSATVRIYLAEICDEHDTSGIPH
jgi:hypothetical protein